MKLKIFIAAVFTLAAGMANSTPEKPDTSLSITRRDSSSVYLLQYTASKTGNVVVTIKDDNGATLVTRSVADTKSFSMPVNFISADEGIYTVQIDNGSEKESQEIDYSNDTPPTYWHVISLGENRYLLTTSHAGTEDIFIRVYDGGGDLVFDEKKTIRGSFSMLFNMRNVAGKPSFEVSESSGHSSVIVQ